MQISMWARRHSYFETGSARESNFNVVEGARGREDGPGSIRRRIGPKSVRLRLRQQPACHPVARPGSFIAMPIPAPG